MIPNRRVAHDLLDLHPQEQLARFCRIQSFAQSAGSWMPVMIFPRSPAPPPSCARARGSPVNATPRGSGRRDSRRSRGRAPAPEVVLVDTGDSNVPVTMEAPHARNPAPARDPEPWRRPDPPGRTRGLDARSLPSTIPGACAPPMSRRSNDASRGKIRDMTSVTCGFGGRGRCRGGGAPRTPDPTSTAPLPNTNGAVATTCRRTSPRAPRSSSARRWLRAFSAGSRARCARSCHDAVAHFAS